MKRVGLARRGLILGVARRTPRESRAATTTAQPKLFSE